MEGFKILDSASNDVNGITKKRFVIGKKNNTRMTFNEVKKVAQLINNKAKKKYKGEPKMIVRVLSDMGVRTLTFKGYDDDLDNLAENEEDYLKGRVRDPTQFNKMYQAEISYFYE
jgi:hypothetical protein